jgi:hypothetical protein
MTNQDRFNQTPHYAQATRSTPAPQQASASPGPTKASRALFSPDQYLVKIGQGLADDVFQTRNWERLRPYITDANSKDETTRKNGTAVMLGLAERSAHLLKICNDKGYVKLNGEIVTEQDIQYAFKTDLNRFMALLNSVTDTMARVTAAVPGLKIDQHRADEKPAAPVKVEVVGLPIRKTTTEILRDKAGDIATSIQVESDA